MTPYPLTDETMARPDWMPYARTLPIPRVILPALRRLLAERDADAPLFPGRVGQPMHPTSLLHLLRHRRHNDQPATGFFVAAGLPDDVTIHHLRHTAGQLLAEAACPEDVRGAILGHTAGTITRYYSPPPIATMRPFVDAVAEALAGELARQRAAA